MRTLERPVVIAVAVTTVLLLCGVVLVKTTLTDDRQRTVDPDTPLAEQCSDVPDGARRIVVTAPDEARLGAALLRPDSWAPGDPLVVLRHGASQTLCDWLDWADDTRDATSAAVLLMDRRGQGSSPGRADLGLDPTDILAATEAVDAAAHPLVLVGSSMGNATTWSLLPLLAQPPCGVVGISPVPLSPPLDGAAAFAAHVDRKVPGTSAPDTGAPDTVSLVWTREDGGIPTEAAALADIARAAGSTVRKLELDGNAHSYRVLDEHPEARAFVRDAVAACS